jgi:inosine-uridine nucleoside N-ribohydrolase
VEKGGLMAEKVIFDTDPGIDDAMALLFLQRHPEIDLVGITTVFGNSSIETTTRNALYLKQLWDIGAPVAKGAGEALVKPRGPDVTIVHGDNGLGNVPVPETVDVPLDPRPAHRFIIDMVRASPGEITLCAVGRMTNLALALREDPEIAGLVKAVVLMGGAVGVSGNVTPVAEANIIGDPHAADVVTTAPWPLVLVGLDVTRKTVMTRAMLKRLVTEGGAPAQFLSDISQHYIDFYSRHLADGMLVHDTCACLYVVAPELFTMQRGAIRVVPDGIAEGQTIQRADGVWYRPGPWDGLPSQSAAVDIDAEAAMALIHDTLVRPG